VVKLFLLKEGTTSSVGISLKVSTIDLKRPLKKLKLEPGGLCLSVPLSACVGQGDTVQVENGEAWVVCKNGFCQFLPVFVARDELRLGDSSIELLVKEITEPEEYQAVRSLADYHYRDSQLYGRTAVLIARNFHPFYPRVLGYVELATPFYMNKARARILDAPFSCNGISWESWDKETTRKYINLMVRIARCVVYPEFRGLGLGQTLVKYAVEFVKTRWQTSKYLPFFLEISADMLRFVPFAEKAGMVFIGETQGNLNRVYKDMEYLTRNADRVRGGEIVSQESSGIVDQQVARMNRILSLIEKRGLSRDDILRRLKRLSRDQVLRDFALFHNIVSLPKPTYMKGLNLSAEEFLLERAKLIQPRSSKTIPSIQLEPLQGPVELHDITLSFTSRVRRTKLTHSVQQAFGISPDSIESVVVRHLSLDIQPGEIVLVLGPSASGKTTLINFLATGKRVWKEGQVKGNVSWPTNYKPGTFKRPRSLKALVELMQVRDVSSALSLMGLVGLSDAFVYLKRFNELSKGQQYRAMLARMIAGGYNVWLIDEFCANLDQATANVITDKLQSLARTLGATVVVAAPHCDAFVSTLRPDKVIKLTTAWEHQILRGVDFVQAVRPNHLHRGRIISLRLRPELFKAVRCGQKTSTIRTGRKHIEPGPLILESPGESLLVNVTTVTYKRFTDLSDEDARTDGYATLTQLQDELRSVYPKLRKNSPLTVVEFQQAAGNEAIVSPSRSAIL